MYFKNLVWTNFLLISSLSFIAKGWLESSQYSILSFLPSYAMTKDMSNEELLAKK